MQKPKLALAESKEQEPKKPDAPGLESTTWEQRKRMTAAELIVLMGPLHVHHKGYQPRPGSLVKVPNLANEQPTVSCHEGGILGDLKRAMRWFIG
jgi:hypothetical protein